ncbi:putative odorant-binding protein A10 [Orchesella cincta]|uniref:Putative odorant-binding protein A10 n=1 Tax=Orchesella cincta TaxID=48709 RepID=A0A1D2NCL2_ORCCI|nr:putative odorant-binding protein A10 [Orchesella cincta]
MKLTVGGSSVARMIASSAFVILSVKILVCASYRGVLHPLTYQRQIDYLDVEQYFRNSRLMRIQIMCIFYDEPCDLVGRWLKPRLFPALFGDCPACTEYQKEKLPQWLLIFADKYPVMFRAVVAQFLMDQGYPVPKEEIPKIQRAFGFRDTRKILNPQSVINASVVAPIGARKDTGPALISYFGRRRTTKPKTL